MITGTLGMAASSSVSLIGTGTSAAATRTTGASSQSNNSSWMQVASSLMNEPSLVLFDEPTSALDSKLGDQVTQLIRSEMKSRGTAAIIVTHDERITQYADRVVHISDGVLESDH